MARMLHAIACVFLFARASASSGDSVDLLQADVNAHVNAADDGQGFVDALLDWADAEDDARTEAVEAAAAAPTATKSVSAKVRGRVEELTKKASGRSAKATKNPEVSLTQDEDEAHTSWWPFAGHKATALVKEKELQKQKEEELKKMEAELKAKSKTEEQHKTEAQLTAVNDAEKAASEYQHKHKWGRMLHRGADAQDAKVPDPGAVQAVFAKEERKEQAAKQVEKKKDADAARQVELRARELLDAHRLEEEARLQYQRSMQARLQAEQQAAEAGRARANAKVAKKTAHEEEVEALQKALQKGVEINNDELNAIYKSQQADEQVNADAEAQAEADAAPVAFASKVEQETTLKQEKARHLVAQKKAALEDAQQELAEALLEKEKREEAEERLEREGEEEEEKHERREREVAERQRLYDLRANKQRDQDFTAQWKSKSAADVNAQLKRLEKMLSGGIMAPDLKKKATQQLNILKPLAEEKEGLLTLEAWESGNGQ